MGEPDPAEQEPGLTIPAGTHVVTRVAVLHPQGNLPEGSVGVIVAAPGDDARYRVRLPDGREIALRRDQLSIRKHVARAVPEQPPPSLDDYRPYIIYRCVVGSRAYGLDQQGSDTDVRGCFLPPAEQHWSIYGVPEQVERHETQETYWELQKFLGLALKSNPNVLECLYTPLVEHAAPLAQELLAQRGRLISRRIYQSYNGYVLSQFKKLEQDMRTLGEIKWKHAMHLIRLLISGIAALREGAVPVEVGRQRDELLAIRRAERPWAEVNAWRLSLHKEFDAAFAASRLPELPDFEWANSFLVRARRSMVEQEAGSRKQEAGSRKQEAGSMVFK